MDAKQISGHLYTQIKRVMPIPCVDLILHIDNKVLLCKRESYPAKGKWWLPGGRVLKGEKLEDAVIRKGREELGVDVIIERQVGAYDNIFKRVHCIVAVYIVRLARKNATIILDTQHSEYKFTDRVDGLHPYLVKELEDSKVFGGAK